MAKVNGIEVASLDELLDVITDDETCPEGNDLTSLPTFGGDEPSDTTEVWSWDADNLIVGTCSDDFKIVSRAEWFNKD